MTTLSVRAGAAAAPAPLSPLSADELVALVERLAADPDRWSHLLRFDSAERHWARVPGPAGVDAAVDVWVLTWLPDQSTALHDHGGSTAAYTVLSGTIEETRVTGGALRTARLATGATRSLAPYAVHDVRGAPDGPAVSLHAYSPPLSRMTWYDRDLVPVRTALTSDPD